MDFEFRYSRGKKNIYTKILIIRSKVNIEKNNECPIKTLDTQSNIPLYCPVLEIASRVFTT